MTFMITESMILQNTSGQSYDRGWNYYEAGAVVTLFRRDNSLYAQVEGSQYQPYEVTIEFDQGGYLSAYCDCPYDRGGWCKHIVATLLAYMHERESVEEKPSLSEMIADLDEDQLRDLIFQLGEANPSLADQIESRLSLIRAESSEKKLPESQPRQRQTSLDGVAIRRQVSGILHSLDRMRASEAYWYVGDVVEQVRQVLDQAWDFIEAGDGENALIFLEAVTDEYAEGWLVLDDSDGYAGGLFGELDPLWTEAILSADLTTEERASWKQKLMKWEREVGDYGIYDIFAAALIALEQGWEYPPLVRAMQGEMPEKGVWAGEAPHVADDLTIARLNVLDRQNRHEEYLNLARAEGQIGRYLSMLVRLGRAQQAVEEGMEYMGTTDEALMVAEALRTQGSLEDALKIAEHGLTLDGDRTHIAIWVRDTAFNAGRTDLALRAAKIAFENQPDLTSYLRVQELAGDRWGDVKLELLEALKRSQWRTSAKIDIYLHEDMREDAIEVVNSGYVGYDALERVVKAVMDSHPDWAIRQSKNQAESIMDAGKSKHYHHAAKWLGLARQAYLGAGREAEWGEYLSGLMETHQRKYALMPRLEELAR